MCVCMKDDVGIYKQFKWCEVRGDATNVKHQNKTQVLWWHVLIQEKRATFTHPVKQAQHWNRQGGVHRFSGSCRQTFVRWTEIHLTKLKIGSQMCRWSTSKFTQTHTSFSKKGKQWNTSGSSDIPWNFNLTENERLTLR